MKYDLEKVVKSTITKYHLIDKNQKVVVALSGGKDSTTVLYLLHKFGYNVEALMIDLKLGEWSKKHLENMTAFCDSLNVKLHVFDLRKELGRGICFIKAILKEKKGLSGCSVCGVLKKWILNKQAKKMGFDRIATGHNLDDEAQTVLMNFLKGNVFLGLNSSPLTGSLFGEELNRDKKFAQRIKPLFFVPEHEVRKFAQKMKFPVLYEKCPCAFATYRVETRDFTKDLSDKQRLKIVLKFQKIIPSLKNKTGARELLKCEKCGEPSRSKVCRACEILNCLREN